MYDAVHSDLYKLVKRLFCYFGCAFGGEEIWKNMDFYFYFNLEMVTCDCKNLYIGIAWVACPSIDSRSLENCSGFFLLLTIRKDDEEWQERKKNKNEEKQQYKSQ